MMSASPSASSSMIIEHLVDRAVAAVIRDVAIAVRVGKRVGRRHVAVIVDDPDDHILAGEHLARFAADKHQAASRPW